MQSEAASRADFSLIRYAQVWEDADVLLAGLAIQPGDHCLSIASAGDNALAMLTQDPARVVAIDLNPAQLACVELRVAAYRRLSHHGLLQLIGSRPCQNRAALYKDCRDLLSDPVRSFWDARLKQIEKGIGSLGKFESYFRMFSRMLLPMVHSGKTIDALLRGGTRQERELFYERRWNNMRWRTLFAFFFSRQVMGALGRDPAFFHYVEGSVADRILARTRHALVELNPPENPYLHWILKGTHGEALPLALREEHFETIRERLDRFEWRMQPLEAYLEEAGERSIDRYNLSDVFEYISIENYHTLLDRLVRSGRSGGRLAYWNMLAPRRRPESMGDRLRSLEPLGLELLKQDKAFFYSAFVVEEMV